VIKAPRGTFDVLPEDAVRRRSLERQAERILGAAGYRRIETPTFEATELFARGVGEATDIVRKEMYTFDDGGGRSLTLRPEGTAPVCRAYIEHGMHKLPQPVKLWYLSSFLRAEGRPRRESNTATSSAITSGRTRARSPTRSAGESTRTQCVRSMPPTAAPAR
jgi:histidyl-tRNA synthetase